MQRREFIRLSLVTGAAGILLPRQALADGHEASMAGGVYYTKDAPGRWDQKVAGHLPVLETDTTKGLVRITTGHEMKGYEHYIVKHTLLNSNFEFVSEKVFNPEKEMAPISEHSLEGLTGTVYALSMCNLHDVWLNSIEV
ncbi:desulfoferrodoxin family protein [Ferrimonas marina]|uniref:Superoxide reductase n=1 Tax=Ferrimonas marina TaxID=299255 RepID=A0A1M5P0X1_9GAMM|nr:desulfoferrodoxin family protein [Ferrimonas marina]SHG95421.1 superoxide reductase [Ferrimonas marina]